MRSSARSKPGLLTTVVLASVTLSASPVDGPAVLSLRARDSRSGLPIDGVVADIGSGELRVAMRDDGTMRTTLDPGRRDPELRAPRHRSLRTFVDLRSAETLEVTVWLDPLEPLPGQEPSLTVTK